MDDRLLQDAVTEPQAPAAFRRLPPPGRWALMAVLAVVLYALLGTLGVPWLVRSKLPAAVAARTGATAHLGQVRFDPFRFRLELLNAELRTGQEPPLLGFGRLNLDLGFWQSFSGVLHVDSIRLQEPYVNARIDREGQLNLAALRARAADGAALPVRVEQLTVEGGRLDFADFSGGKPFRKVLEPIRLDLSGLALDTRGGPASYRLAAGRGESLALEGTVTAEPLQTQGRLEARNLVLKGLWHFAPEGLAFAVQGGTVDFAAGFALAARPLRASLAQGTLALKGLELADRGSGRVLLAVPELALREIAADTAERRLAVGAASSTGGRLEAWLTAEGRFNLAEWLPGGAAAPGTGPAGSPGPPPQPGGSTGPAWSVRVDEATLDGYTLDFEDRRLPEPVAVTLAPFRLAVKDFTTPGDRPVRVALAAGVNETGRVGLDGEIAPDSLSGNVAVKLEGLALPRFQPYLDRFARLALAKGSLDLDGRVSLKPDEAGGMPAVGYAGSARLTGVETRLPGREQPLFAWESLDLSGLDLQSQPPRAEIGDVVANRLYARLVVKPDRSLNVAEVFPEPPRATAGPKDRGEPAPLPFAVKLIRIENSRADFSDQSIDPPFSLGIQDLRGTVKGVNSRRGQAARVQLEGRMGPYAPVKVEGRMNVFSPARFGDVQLHVSNADMTALSPYAGKFAGYRIKMGKLSIDTDYQLRNGRLDSENRVVLNRLVLGEPVPSPEAADLPLHLVIALLKDSEGRIELNLPIRGDLSDPKVSLPGLLGKVFRGLVRKAASTPFALLARLGGRREGNLGEVGFLPGESELQTEQVEQLAALARALRERPSLYLEITGVAGPERDRRALAEKNLINRLKAAKLMDEGRPPDPGAIRGTVLSQADYERYLAELYRQETRRQPPGSLDRMREALVEPAEVSDNRLRVLAQERTAAIRGFLVESQGLLAARLYATEVRLEPGTGPRVLSRLGLNAG